MDQALPAVRQAAAPEPLTYHNQPVWCDGRIAGDLTSGSYRHPPGAAVGLACVKCEPGESAADTLGATCEIEVPGQRYAAAASLKPQDLCGTCAPGGPAGRGRRSE